MKKTVLALVLGTAALLIPPSLAFAQKIAPQACDPGYWQSMKERAWLEAEREIMQNQNLIFKPDSVLEYSCFDKFLSHAGKTLGDIFVHTAYFGTEIISRGQAESQNNAIKSAAYEAMKTFVTTNFSPTFLADRSTGTRIKPSPNDHDMAMQPPQSGGPLYGDCKIMAEVWKASKCMNFVDRKDYTKSDLQAPGTFANDSFHPFVKIEKGPGSKVREINGYQQFEDMRTWARPCGNMKKEEWKQMYDWATNKDEKRYTFDSKVKKAYEEVRKMVEPGQCSTAIKTGVTIVLSGEGKKTQEDGFCTNPGCTYNGNKCQ